MKVDCRKKKKDDEERKTMFPQIRSWFSIYHAGSAGIDERSDEHLCR